MQKLVYLLQNAFDGDLGYEYDCHHLGPYSYELADDLSLGAQAELWAYETRQQFSMASGHSTGHQYRTLASSCAFPETKKLAEQYWQEVAPSMEALLTHIQGMSGRQIELIATLHYLRHVQEVGETDLREVLKALKPRYSDQEFVWGTGQLAKTTALRASVLQCSTDASIHTRNILSRGGQSGETSSPYA